MDKIISYLKEKYKPLAIVTYGSFNDSMQDEYSDFDSMIIVKEKNNNHDNKVIDGIPLDCFIFTEDEVKSDNLDPFITIYDGNIILDTDDIALKLKMRVQSYAEEHKVTSLSDKEFIRSWIDKTLKRIDKKDDEGNYRALLLLTESLSCYCELRDMFYFGSKKTVKYLKEYDQLAYDLFHKAVTGRSNEDIKNWALYIKNK